MAPTGHRVFEALDRKGSFAQVLRRLYSGRRTGALLVVQDKTKKIVYFREGYPVSVRSKRAAALPRYFGYGRGLTFYTWTSDHSGDGAYVITDLNSAAPQAAVLPDGRILVAVNALSGPLSGTVLGVVDPNLAPFGLRMRDNAEVARRQADRFVSAYRKHAG